MRNIIKAETFVRILLFLALMMILLMLFSGCRTASDNMRIAKKHLLLAEAKGAKITADTVYKTITVTVPERHFDTVVRVQNFHDTVFVKGKDGIVIKWKYNTETKKVYVDCKCPEVKKTEEVPITVTQNIKAPWTDFFTDLLPWWLWVLFLIAFVVIFASRILIKRS